MWLYFTDILVTDKKSYLLSGDLPKILLCKKQNKNVFYFLRLHQVSDDVFVGLTYEWMIKMYICFPGFWQKVYLSFFFLVFDFVLQYGW